MIGGGGQWESKTLEVLHAYDLDQDYWHVWKCEGDTQHGYPVSRSSFACELLQDNLCVFGGRHYTKNQGEWGLNSCWMLNLVTLRWQRMQLTLPLDLTFLTSCVDPAGHVYVFGGIRVDKKRSNALFRVRLYVPKLRELCWERVTASMKQAWKLSKKHITTLRSLGVPEIFTDRLE